MEAEPTGNFSGARFLKNKVFDLNGGKSSVSKKKIPLIILHIGTPKTGSSSIQVMLSENNKAFLSQGLHVFNAVWRKQTDNFLASFREEVHSKLGEFSLYSQSLGKTALADLSAVIVSSERFSSRLSDPSHLAELKEFLEGYADQVRIICFVRDQAELAFSHYSQELKFGNALRLDEYLNKIDSESLLFNHWKLANLWSSVFGKDKIVFRTYDKSNSIHSDVRSDFLDCLTKSGVQIKRNELRFREDRNNESLSLFSASAVRAVNDFDKSQGKAKHKWHEAHSRNQEIRNAIEQLGSLKFDKLTNPLSVALQSTFDETNQKFFDNYLPGEKFSAELRDNPRVSLPVEVVDTMIYEITRQLLLVTKQRSGFRKNLLMILRKCRGS